MAMPKVGGLSSFSDYGSTKSPLSSFSQYTPDALQVGKLEGVGSLEEAMSQGKEGKSGTASGMSPIGGAASMGAGALGQSGITGPVVSPMLSMGGTGAGIGTMIAPGPGTAIGAGIGSTLGLMQGLFGGSGGPKPQVPVSPAKMGGLYG